MPFGGQNYMHIKLPDIFKEYKFKYFKYCKTYKKAFNDVKLRYEVSLSEICFKA